MNASYQTELGAIIGLISFISFWFGFAAILFALGYAIILFIEEFF